MRYGSALCVLCLTACSSGGVGDHCSDRGDCGGSLQCVENVCEPACDRAPDCGDGFACVDHTCRESTGELGDNCTSEVECAPGLSCTFVGPTSLAASCVAEQSGAAAGETCSTDGDCRNGTCALGRCVDLCNDSSDCIEHTSCTQIPRVEAAGGMFNGCLQALGTVAWDIPISGPQDTVQLPIPANAHAVAVTFQVSDSAQLVGALQLTSPSGANLIDLGPDPSMWPMMYFAEAVRHEPGAGESVLAMPSSPDTPLETGAYSMKVSSLRGSGVGTATPTVTAVIKLDTDVQLDLHFYFLDFTDHPCTSAFSPMLNADFAASATFFQNDYLSALRSTFADSGIQLGTITYDDISDHPELDAPEQASEAALLALGKYSTGVNVFFVRTLSPVGLEALGPNPGPAGLPGTAQSGVIVSLDSLCDQSWSAVARVTAHEIAKYMGLYENYDLAGHMDPIQDSDMSSNNLMFDSELGGTDLSPGQRAILARSVVLQ